MKKLAPVCAIAFVIFYVANTPTDAASLVQSTVCLLGNIADGISHFVTAVA
ncbi:MULTISPECIES: hypothetical protein [unclassified Frankia]|uniref:hypothetical protein n=1 Tax=unclassified Frankia TaxID=2632575 RepID=UPI001EF4BA8E|nr:MULTISPECIES: hypothetical protein [unclassified Frankia]